MRSIALVLLGALAVGCDNSSGSSGTLGVGEKCTCGDAALAGGDVKCSGSYTQCQSSLACVDGVCSVLCELDGGNPCPAGYGCRQTPHSNLATYCAPVGD